MRVYVGSQIRHPRVRIPAAALLQHPVASCGTRASNACDSLDLGSSAFFVVDCGCSHPVAGKSGVSRPARCTVSLYRFVVDRIEAEVLRGLQSFSCVPA